MPTIPSVLDYGAQPSLQTSRLDLPGQGNLAIADSIAAAAETFAQFKIEGKQKVDAFNYAMRIKELQSADLAQREKLKDDPDYESYDEKYIGGMQTDWDRITEKYPLDASDAAMAEAEGNLIRARGRSSVQEFRRIKEIDDKLATLDAAIALVKEEVHIAPPGESNALLLTALDLINAAEEQRLIDKIPAQAMRENLVQTVSRKKLQNMDAKERAEILRGSLKYRKKHGPITEKQIRANEGTGYIADFLYTADAKAMLEIAEKELEIDNAQEQGFATNDKAWEVDPGLSSDAMTARMKTIRDAGLSAEARKVAEAANTRRILMEANIRSEGYREADDQLKVLIDDGAAWEELPGELRSVLPPAMLKVRKDYADAARRQEDFPSVTSSDAVEAYAALSLQEQIDWSPDNWMVRPPLLDPKRWGDHVTRGQATAWTDAGGQLRRAVAAGKVPEKGLTLTQQLEAVFILVMKKPTAASDHSAWKKWNRMLLKYHNAAIKLGGEDSLTEQQQIDLAMDITQFEVYERMAVFDISGTNWATMSQEQIERGYLKLGEPVPPFGFTAYTMELDHSANAAIGMPAFKGLAIDWLKEIGAAVNPSEEGLEPDEEVLTEAWFYLVTTGPEAALNRLRGLPGY